MNNENKPRNDFQSWSVTQGYYRTPCQGGVWAKDGAIVTGVELSDKLNEWNYIHDQKSL